MLTSNTINSHTNECLKRNNFLRLSGARLKEALEQIRLLKNCFSNPYAYQYDYRDVERITEELQAAIDQLKRYRRMQLDPEKLRTYLST